MKYFYLITSHYWLRLTLCVGLCIISTGIAMDPIHINKDLVLLFWSKLSPLLCSDSSKWIAPKGEKVLESTSQARIVFDLFPNHYIVCMGMYKLETSVWTPRLEPGSLDLHRRKLLEQERWRSVEGWWKTNEVMAERPQWAGSSHQTRAGTKSFVPSHCLCFLALLGACSFDQCLKVCRRAKHCMCQADVEWLNQTQHRSPAEQSRRVWLPPRADLVSNVSPLISKIVQKLTRGAGDKRLRQWRLVT